MWPLFLKLLGTFRGITLLLIPQIDHSVLINQVEIGVCRSQCGDKTTDRFMDVIVGYTFYNSLFLPVLLEFYSDANRVHLYLELASQWLNPVTAGITVMKQAGCRKQLTHAHLLCTPTLFPQLWSSLRCCYYSHTKSLSDHMSQPTFVFRVGYSL